MYVSSPSLFIHLHLFCGAKHNFLSLFSLAESSGHAILHDNVR